MWKSFIGAVEKVFPEAILIHDRFHLIQHLNKAINQVRRREVKNHSELKGSRYALLKRIVRKNKKKSSRRSRNPTQCECRLREDFKAIFECTSFNEAKEYFNLWLQEASVKEVMKLAEMFESHFVESATHYGTHSPMLKQRGLMEKFKRSKPLVEDTGSLKISELRFSSSVAVWISTHTIRDKPLFL